MESYRIENLTFKYPASEENALKNISLSIHAGEFLTVCGKSGCGKSTLLRQLKPVLAPHGTKTGTVLFMGKDIGELDFRTQSEKIGFVLQSPDNQIVTDKVWHELAFGLESLGVSTPEIRARVAEMASFFGIQTWFHKSVTELSGGQKQLLNLASVMVMQPSVLILDEPTSQLDPIAAQDFLETLAKINRELGTTVILSEHRLEEALAISDRVIVMDRGAVIADGSPSAVGGRLKALEHEMFDAMPAAMRAYAGIEKDGAYPVTVREGRAWLDGLSERIRPKPVPVCESAEDARPGRPVVEVRDVFFRYERNLPDVIRGLSMKIYEGEFYAVVGGNGTGKTTALSLISGVNTPYRGEIRIGGERMGTISGLYDGLIGVLPQNPQSLFVKKTVLQDLCEILSDRKLPKEEQESAVAEVVRLCELESLLGRHPYDLSGGEQQRAALAKLLLLRPRILLLDEPTKGLDAHFKQKLAAILQNLKAAGVTVLMVSHDIEFCAGYADRCAMFFDGCIVSEGRPREFFSGKSFYTTAANRMARQHLPDAVLAEDIAAAYGGRTKKREPETQDMTWYADRSAPDHKRNGRSESAAVQTPRGKRKLTKRTAAAMGMILLAVPLTIYTGIYFLGDRKYYFISLMILLETMLPFALVFESRKPQARELVIISVLCAVGVAGRAAAYMLPQFKPVAAIVIIAGVCFGGETGFLVGAVTSFVSNFFFGQGPWTPWQMFAFGLIGFLAGVLFRKGVLRKTKTSLCLFGGLATLVIYGGIMNPASVILWQAKPNAAMFLAAYAQGLPFDLIHAAATVFFLWLAAKPMIEKLERIKIKYGIIE